MIQASTHKKILLRMMAGTGVSGSGLPAPGPGGLVAGYIDAAQLGSHPHLDLLTPAGVAHRLPSNEIQAVYFVPDFDGVEAVARSTHSAPARSGQALARGRSQGLWMRIRCRDRQVLEGVMENDLEQIPSEGYWLLPVDPAVPCPRFFIPRTAVETVTVLEILRAPRAPRRPRAGAGPRAEQIDLFTEEVP